MRRVEAARTNKADSHAHPGTDRCREDTAIRANGAPALAHCDSVGGRGEEVVLEVFRSEHVDPVSSGRCQLKIVDEIKVVGCFVALAAIERGRC